MAKDTLNYGLVRRQVEAGFPVMSRLEHYRKICLASPLLWSTLDRVNVLGDPDENIGHTGCVNALSWTADGRTLVSSGDDLRICLWNLEPDPLSANYSFACDKVIRTGHTSNIFNARFLPSTSRIATCAADGQVRVYDANRAIGGGARGAVETGEEACLRVFKCHRSRVKRIVVGNLPDFFMTVSEDNTVRQHDMRLPHSCMRRTDCPAPLLRVNYKLMTMTMSSLDPSYIVVAGRSPFGHMFDRRMIPASSKAEQWGIPSVGDEKSVTCVRRFGREPRSKRESDPHITGSRLSDSNGHELLLSYSDDGIYRYSIHDEPISSRPKSKSPDIISEKRPRAGELAKGTKARQEEPATEASQLDTAIELASTEEPSQHIDDDSEDEESTSDDSASDDTLPTLRMPIVHPRMRYSGHCNCETIKDVNFIGPFDDYVVSGSDDGNFFMWNKSDGKLAGLYEGDRSVVNVIESNPYLPLVAVSGIDYTVKLFAPSDGPSQFSRLADAEQIISRNSRPSGSTLMQMLLRRRLERAVRMGELDEECRVQ